MPLANQNHQIYWSSQSHHSTQAGFGYISDMSMSAVNAETEG